jgi:hypothetical protein
MRQIHFTTTIEQQLGLPPAANSLIARLAGLLLDLSH